VKQTIILSETDNEGPTTQKTALAFSKARNGHCVTSNGVQG